MLIVLDTNVIVSGLINPNGYPGEILDTVVSGAVDLAINDRIWAEYKRILGDKKFPFSHEALMSFLEYVQLFAQHVSAPPATFRSLDATDQPFVDVLCASDADFLVTGNLKDFKHAPKVISPKDFVLMLQKKKK